MKSYLTAEQISDLRADFPNLYQQMMPFSWLTNKIHTSVC